MDLITAIAAASSITSLIQFSGTVLSNGYSYLKNVAKASKELRLLLTETARLNALVDQVQLLAEDDAGAGKSAVFNLERLGAIAESRDVLLAVDKCIAACQEVEGQSAKNLGKRLLWPLKERETKELLERFHRVQDNFTSALSIDAAAALKQIKRSLKEAEDDRAYFKIEADQRRKEEERAKLKAWLSYETVCPEENYDAALRLRQPGTSSWFLQDPGFVQWLSESNGLMWVYGIPGSGKTVLSSAIVENLLTRVCTDIGLVYFFCDHQDPKKQSFRNFVGVGIDQLLNQAPQYIEDMIEFHERKRRKPGGDLTAKPSIEESVQLLKTFTLRFNRVFVVVDALDECKDIEAFVNGLNELRSSTNTKTTAQILTTSRQEVEVEREILKYHTDAMCLNDKIGPDIQKFITEQVRVRISTGKLKLRDPGLRTGIIAALCNGADGMFLWAKLQLDRICRLRNDRDIRKALVSLPTGLDETFVRILEHIKAKNPDDVEEIKKVFQWVIGSTYPLPLSAIAEAISIQPEDKNFDRDGVANDLDDIVAVCGSLLIVDRSSDISRIAMAHFSIEEFLQSDRIKQSSVSVFYMEPSSIHAEIAKTCIQYLSFSEFDLPHTRDEIRLLRTNYALLSYASQNWITHLNASEMDKETFLDQVLPRLFWFVYQSPRCSHFHTWTQFFYCSMPALERGYGRKQHMPRQPAIFYALLYGIHLVLDIVFPQDSEIHQRFWDGMTPLHVAVFAGDSSSTKRLLKGGAQTEARTDCKRLSPLHIAAERGHTHIVKILLANKADPHARSQSGSTPLYRCPRGGSLEVLEMLRAYGSDINAHTWDFYTPLHEAVEANDLAFVDRLLEWGADAGIHNRFGYTPLSLAKALGMWNIAEALGKQESANLVLRVVD